MEEEAVYLIALTRVPTIGYVHAKLLLNHFGSAAAVFRASFAVLQQLDGIGEIRARNILQYNEFQVCRKLVQQHLQHGVRIISLLDSDYPQQLRECYDPPSILYLKGQADLNPEKSVAIIGTRHHTDYGRLITEKMIAELAAHQVTIVSGMAFGIDGIAHRTALGAGLPTLGILAHGLDHVYPQLHAGLGKDILQSGGALLSEFPIGTKAERHHFPIRNRIVAGICKAVIIVETGVRGGSMITAGMANSYQVPVFAVPGRTTDKMSAGCLALLKDQKALPFCSVKDFLDDMQWVTDRTVEKQPLIQLSLIEALDIHSTTLISLLQQHQILTLEQLYILSGLSAGAAARAILDLEMAGLIKLLPGKRYSLP